MFSHPLLFGLGQRGTVRRNFLDDLYERVSIEISIPQPASPVKFLSRIHSWTIGEALGFRGLMRAAKEKRKGYLLFRCSA